MASANKTGYRTTPETDAEICARLRITPHELEQKREAMRRYVRAAQRDQDPKHTEEIRAWYVGKLEAPEVLRETAEASVPEIERLSALAEELDKP